MTVLRRVGILLYLVAVTFEDVLASKCSSKCFSRYDYEEKLLQKLVHIEYQIELVNSEKSERKKELKSALEEFREKSAGELRKQSNLTALLAETLNSEKIDRSKLFESEIKELKDKSADELQKQKTITSELLEMKVKQTKLLESEIKEFKRKQTKELEKQQNLTALLYKNLSSEKTKRLQTFNAEMEDFKSLTVEEIHKQRNLSAMLQMNDTLLSFLKAPVVVFTVTMPSVGSTSDSVTFTNAIINEGGGFDATTGRFKCPVPGIYFFNVNLVKKSESSINEIVCYIKKNGLAIMRVQLPKRKYGVYSASNSINLSLSAEDVVTIAGCYNQYHQYRRAGPASTMESWSSFSGYLVRPYLLVPIEN